MGAFGQMKVLYIASTDDRLGGAKSLLEMVGLMNKSGIEVVVVNPFYNQLNVELTKLGIENYSSGYHLNICKKDCSGVRYCAKFLAKYFRYKILQVRGIINLEKQIDFTEIDIIHINNSVQDIGVYFAKKYSIPLVWHLREFGELDFNFRYFHQKMGKYISKYATKAIAISDAIKNEWVRKGLDPQKIVTIVHGVNPDGIKQRSTHDELTRMVFSGTIVPQKGQMDFIRALTHLDKVSIKKFRLDLYGNCDDKYRKEVEDYIEKNDLKGIVELKGYSNNLKEQLCKYDVGIVNSRCEAMGRVTIEYMMAGLCVLASDTGANTELLNSGEYGVLYEYGSPDSIVSALAHLADNQYELWNLGNKARVYALENYSIKENYLKYIELYKTIYKKDFFKVRL